MAEPDVENVICTGLSLNGEPIELVLIDGARIEIRRVAGLAIRSFALEEGDTAMDVFLSMVKPAP